MSAELFTSTTPTKDGWYWWRLHAGDPPVPADVYLPRCGVRAWSGPIEKLGGEWGPPCPLPVAPPVECEAFISPNGFPVIQGMTDVNGTYPAEDAVVRFKCVLVPVERMPEVGVVEAFANLREASGGRWDGVDPEKFVQDLRSDE